MLSANGGGPNDIKSVLVHAGETQTVFDFDSSTVTASNMRWTMHEVFFHANVDSTRIAFNSLSPLYWGPAIDDVRLFAVPSPGTASLTGLALIAGAPRRRRR